MEYSENAAKKSIRIVWLPKSLVILAKKKDFTTKVLLRIIILKAPGEIAERRRAKN